MTSLYILLGIIVFFFLALFVSNYVQRRKGNTRQRETLPPAIDVRTKQERDSGCCGMHEVCEKDSLIAAFTEKPEYFDDEELDRFQNRDSDGYSNREADEFREVFYSVLDAEKPRWIRSLQVRGIAVPNQLKDEIVMLVNDLREAKMHA
ncbi:phospholipase [Petrimonas sp.]|uniref:phospholipase n=1 Tax=Petrimonas sp. TaxID=2023866 RepID=UPI003F516A6C